MPDQSKSEVAKLVVVVSAGQSRNPEKRSLENMLAEKAAELEGVKVVKVPHLYDLSPTGESFELLKHVPSDLFVASWLYDRAAHWVLDRNGVRGQVGEVELRLDDETEEESEDKPEDSERVVSAHPRPDRKIYCVDLRASSQVSDFLDEIRRILELQPSSRIPLTLDMLQRFEQPTNDTFVGANLGAANELNASETENSSITSVHNLFGAQSVTAVDEHPGRRWYPVIDFSRCTNCMECIDFCLFGVYGIDSAETILVEQADNCRKGCPACSRVCPENAIIFPQHKTPAIAGAPVDAGGLKIDLSKLFGAPEKDEDAMEVAARERDEQLILAGREAVGKDLVQQRLNDRQSPKSNDDLDGLIDELDALDL